MKKALAFILALVLLLSFATCVYATSIDLDGLSDDEIISLYQEIQKQIVDRKIEKTAQVSAGEYLVGTDIPAGSYIIKNNNTGEDDSAYVAIYTDTEKQDMEKSTNLHAGDEIKYVLDEGKTFEVRHQTVDMTVDIGVVFE